MPSTLLGRLWWVGEENDERKPRCTGVSAQQGVVSGRELIHHFVFSIAIMPREEAMYTSSMLFLCVLKFDVVRMPLPAGNPSGVGVWSEQTHDLIILHPNLIWRLHLLANPRLTSGSRWCKRSWVGLMSSAHLKNQTDFSIRTRTQKCNGATHEGLAAYLSASGTSRRCWHRDDPPPGTWDWRCCPRWPWHPWTR